MHNIIKEFSYLPLYIKILKIEIFSLHDSLLPQHAKISKHLRLYLRTCVEI